MNNIDIANGMIFHEMGISKDTFDDRLICQKKVYLLEALGTDLGYTFNWYVRGPYSPSLTNYVYNNLEVLKANDFSQYNLSAAAKNNIDKVNNLLDAKKQDMSNASWYELLASLFYIFNNKKSWRIDDDKKESLFEILMKHKPQYNNEQCEYAYSVLWDRCFITEGV